MSTLAYVAILAGWTLWFAGLLLVGRSWAWHLPTAGLALVLIGALLQ